MTLTVRRHFLACAKGARWTTPNLMVQGLRRVAPEGPDSGMAIRFGVTASKKVGNAVVRNRAKRRMRELARALLPVHGMAGCDYVLIARLGLADAPWPALKEQAALALTRLARSLRTTPRAALPPDRQSAHGAPCGDPPEEQA